DRVYQLFGRQALDELVEIPSVSAPFRAAITEPQLDPEEERASLTVTGLTSRPEVQRLNRNGIYVFVNRRLVRDRLILHAIHEAYRNILPPTVFPATLLFLEMPYEEVDVNVHPAKIEVRFRRSHFVHDFTRDTIRHALMSARPIASFATAAATNAAPPQAQRFGNGGLPGGLTPAPLGQVNSSFIVAVNGEGLWIVDQHVAHERVLFEQHLEARRAGQIEAQRMLVPLVIELSPRQIVTFEKIAKELGANGFEVELMG